MIALPVRLTGPAHRVTALILAAALLRAALLPVGDGISTAVFGACLLGIVVSQRGPSAVDGQWGRGASIGVGLALGLMLVAPLFSGVSSGRSLSAFWQWGAIAALIATLEEVAIRGRLHQSWTQEAGPAAAVLIGALVFAAIHFPRYGPSAMPLDFAAGLALGGLRAITGRVMPGAIAHVIADWGVWFLA